MLPKHLDEKVARLHLDALGAKLTELRARAGRLHRRARSRARTSPTTTATSRRGTEAAAAVRRSPTLGLAAAGEARIEWADGQMPVLRSIRERFAAERPLDGHARRRLPARHRRDRQPRARAASPAAREVALCASNPLVHAGRRRRGARARHGAEVHARPRRGRRRLRGARRGGRRRARRRSRSTTAPTCSPRCTRARPSCSRGLLGGDRGDDDRARAAARAARPRGGSRAR